MAPKPAEKELAVFLDKYSPEIAGLTREALTQMRARLPGAFQLVYDNYNALVIGFGPTERASDALFSIAAYPRWVTLFFLKGGGLKDPEHRLSGKGRQVRSLVLDSAKTLDDPAVRSLMTNALAAAGVQLTGTRPGPLIVKSVSAKQRPRRPAGQSQPSPRSRSARARQ